MMTFLPALLLALAAQDDIYAQLKLGNRIQVTFRHGATLSGTLVAVARDPKIKIDELDYTKETTLTIDMSWEYPGLTGTMSIPKDQIKEVRKLQALDPTTRKAIEEQTRLAKLQTAKDEEERREAGKIKDEAIKKAVAEKLESETKGLNEAEKAKKLELIKKSLELRKKFPPGEWDPVKVAEAVRQRALNRLPPTPEQREFQENQQLWGMAQQYEEFQKLDKKEEKKEAPPEEKKP